MTVLIEAVKGRWLPMLVLAGGIATLLGAADIGPNAPVRFAIALAAELAFFLVVIEGLTATTQAVVRSRRGRERRRLADRHGWRYDDRDADLPAALGLVHEDVVVDRSGRLVHELRPVSSAARAHAVVRGEARGMRFEAFDYFVPQAVPLGVVTAWRVELPHALPRLMSSEAECRGGSAGDAVLRETLLHGATARGEELATVARPDYAEAVLTEDVVEFSRQGFLSWWVVGNVLAATRHSDYGTHRRFGATAEELVYGIEAVAWLGRILSSPGVARFAVQPSTP
jgi:hypothetical protein